MHLSVRYLVRLASAALAASMFVALSPAPALADVELGVPVVGQQDPAWGATPLGSSHTDTVASAGCAVSAVVMLLSYYGIATNPNALNGWLQTNNGYFGDDDIIWDAVTSYTGGRVSFTGWYGPDLAMIQAELDAGHPVIAEVSLNGNEHFVIIVGSSARGFTINDPWFADTVTFNDRYGDPASGIVSIRTYAPPPPPGPRVATPPAGGLATVAPSARQEQ